MLATKLMLQDLLDSVYGPYRKRGTVSLSVHGPDGVKHFDLSLLQNGVPVCEGITVKRTASGLYCDLPAGAKLFVRRGGSWKAVWDGSSVTLAESSLPITAPADATLRFSLAGKAYVVGILEQRPSALKSALADLFDPRGLWEGAKNFSKSGLVHLSFMVLAGVFGNIIQLPWVNPEAKSIVNLEIEKSQERREIEETIPIVAENAANDAFNGRNMSAPEAQSTDLAHSQQARTETIASGLSNLVAKMSKLSMGSLGKVSSDSANGNERNSAVDSLRYSMGKAKSTDLKGDFKFVSHGSAGKFSKWDLFGGEGKSYAGRDLDQVGEVFRALQEQFRACYETALLKFEDMSVTVRYEVEVQSSGYVGTPKFETSGNSTPEGEKVLNSCLAGVLRHAKVSPNLQGARLRSELIFRP